MLIPNQQIITAWHYTNKQYYEDKGYLFTGFGNKLIVRAEDLNPTSHQKVEVLCDVCKQQTFWRENRFYIKEHDDELGDTCRKCNRQKAMKTNYQRFGTAWALQTETSKAKQKQTCLDRYGVEYISQDPNFRKNIVAICQERYGCDNVAQLEETKEKVSQSFYRNNSCPTSKPQICLHEKLIELFGNSQLNYPCGRCNLDCVVLVNDIPIDVEYDGVYWHKNKDEADKRRNYFVLSKGYKILRILGKDDLPSDEELKQAIYTLAYSDKNLIKINMV